MATAILSIVAYLLPFILDGLREWLAAKKAQEAHTYENDTQTFDQALADRNAAAITVAFDRLSAPPDYNGHPLGQDGQGPA